MPPDLNRGTPIRVDLEALARKRPQVAIDLGRIKSLPQDAIVVKRSDALDDGLLGVIARRNKRK